MSVPYAFNNTVNQTTVDGLAVAISNDLTGGWMFILFLAVVFLILLGKAKNFEFSRAFVAASYVATIIALMLTLLGAIPEFVFVVMVLITAAGTIFLVFR